MKPVDVLQGVTNIHFNVKMRAEQVLSLMAFIGSDDPSATADIMQTLEGLRSAGGTSKQGDPPQDPCTWCDAYLKYTTASKRR